MCAFLSCWSATHMQRISSTLGVATITKLSRISTLHFVLPKRGNMTLLFTVECTHAQAPHDQGACTAWSCERSQCGVSCGAQGDAACCVSEVGPAALLQEGLPTCAEATHHHLLNHTFSQHPCQVGYRGVPELHCWQQSRFLALVP